MALQWVGGIVFALWVSPLAWSGSTSRTHVHVWAAVVLGGLISLFPGAAGAVSAWPAVHALHDCDRSDADGRAADPSHRRPHRNAFPRLRLAGVSGLLSRLARAGSRDGRRRAGSHAARIFWPQSVYGVLVASQWRWLEHAAWVIFEDVFLVVACLRSMAEMRETADRTAALEQEVRTRQQAETDARNSQARNDAILNVALDCVILMDESGRIVQFNPAAERTFGYAASEAVGHQLADLMIPADQRKAHQDALARYLKTGEATGMNRRLELSAIRKAGEIFPVEVAIAPISSDGAAMFAGYMRDITERRRNEAALADYTRDLEVAHETQRQNSQQLATLVDRASPHAAAGRRRNAGQERLPREHEPRAADAAERDHSLQRAAAGAGGR